MSTNAKTNSKTNSNLNSKTNSKVKNKLTLVRKEGKLLVVQIKKQEYILDEDLTLSIIKYLQKDRDKIKFKNYEDIIEYMNEHWMTNKELLEYLENKKG